MFLKRLKVIFALFLSLSAISQNQKKIDSLFKVLDTLPENKEKVKTLARIADTYLYNSNDTGKYYKASLELAEKIGYSGGAARATYNLGNYHFSMGEYNKAIEYYETFHDRETVDDYDRAIAKQAIAISKYYMGNLDQSLELINKNIDVFTNEVESYTNLVNALLMRNQILVEKGHYKRALNSILSGIEILENLKDKKRAKEDPKRMESINKKMCDAYIFLAQIERELERYDEALIHLREADKSIAKIDNKYTEKAIFSGLGGTYFLLKDYEKAEKNYRKAIELAKELKNEGSEAIGLVSIGQIYNAKKHYKEALSYFKKALILTERNNSKQELVLSLNNIGMVYTNLGQYDKAVSHLNRSIAIADSIGLLDNLKRAYNQRSKAYIGLNNSTKALKDFKSYSKLKDSLFSLTKSQQIEELYIIHETKKKQQQIKIQKNEIELLGTKNRVSNLQRILLALALALALIAVYAFYQRNKRNKLAKEKAESDLEFKTKELTTHALHLAKKNEVLNDLKQKAKVLKQDADADPGYQMLIQTINFDLQDDNNWENFSRYFEQVHKGFNSKAQEQFPSVTKNDLRLMALLKMNLSSKEIANILNISSDGIKKARQRLRKKMGLDSNESLEARVISI